ncbi:DNA polymerase [Alphabaculovirus myunipunctae]|uniref:DNA-directed DNA polymerase n=1 Tax=Mythimna unipuncta nucleopolyhedrovirus TaxID=447897 RepID=A0A2K9VSD3_9ABAC|nr:DNA polymerase [Mythimna unipuncta nucleopolyhedrovirus]AUV65367.1 DNA polymerase [Mythimna unipuncta nucleopolyhedrovirus]
MFSLLTYDELVGKLKRGSGVGGSVTIGANDVFRITRMVYKDGHLIVFFTGYINGDRLYQFYMETKCALYSYRKCYGMHNSDRCYYNCVSYKTMVMPGLRGVHSDRLNVVKYERNAQNERHNRFCLDYFLNDINRVHTQTNLKEGQYVRFLAQQRCVDNRLVCRFDDFDGIKELFTVVDPDSLKREIVPVIASYDIETHSNGQRFSNPSIDHIISIGLVVRRDNETIKICLYHQKAGVHDDMDQFAGGDGGDNVMVVRFTNETDMIAAFFKLLPIINADCVLDYNGDKFDLPFLLARAKSSTITKIRRYDLSPMDIATKALFDKFNNELHTHFFGYYTHVDLYRFLSTSCEQNDVENFQLNTVAQHYLNSTKVDLDINEMLRLYDERRMQRIIEYNVQDCVLPIEIFLKIEIMDFMYTQCALLYLSTDDLLSNVSHRLTVAFFYNAINNTRFDEATQTYVDDKYFFNKSDLNVTSGRKRAYNDDPSADAVVDSQVVDLSQLNRTPVDVQDIPADAYKLCHVKQRCVYTGGKVLSPSPGLKKWVVTLDFNSLYLSIMMQEGICLSNLFLGKDNYVYLDKNREAINPKLLKKLLDLRTMYKEKRDGFKPGSFQYNLYDKTQNAVKRIANSIYGYFGIFFKPLANYVTKIGRDKLMEAIVRIEEMSNRPNILERFNLSRIQFKVIYGDTDSSFIQVIFDENEIADNVDKVIRSIVNDYVLKELNAGWVGYKMALENVMSCLILLKKKKYCYLNSENRLKYKGWLVKKDMPIFMRKTFRSVVDSYLLGHSVACGLKLLNDLMLEHHANFGKDNNYSDYSMSMSYNEKPTGKKKKTTSTTTTTTSKKARVDPEAKPRKKVVTVAKHCFEILRNSGTDFLPGNGDRIPYLLIDVKGSKTQKTFPLKLFGPHHRISWLKHIIIMSTFFNELMQIFGTRAEFEYYFRNICSVYMRDQEHDVKYPVLKPISVKPSTKSKRAAKKDSDDDDNDDNDDEVVEEGDNVGDDDEGIVLNHTHQFSLYARLPKQSVFGEYKAGVCKKCQCKC